jgi:hypothetical protein
VAVRNGRALAWAVLAYYTIAQWPGGYSPIAAGLDESWMYAMNVLFNAGPVFGREVSFTYGPLGFLLAPRAVDGNLTRALLFWIAVHLSTVALLITAVRRDRLWQACGVVGLAAVAQVVGVWPDYWAALVTGLFACSALLMPGRAWPWAVLAGGLAGALGAMKLPSGVAAGSILVLALTILPATIERKKQVAALAFGAMFLVWLPIFFTFFDGLGSFMRWLQWSAEISSGYPVAMSLIRKEPLIWDALFVAIAYAAFLGYGSNMQRKLTGTLALILFVSFRHSYIRQDTHTAALFTTACAVPVLLIFFAENRRERAAVLALAAVCAGITVHHYDRPNSGMGIEWARTWDYLSLKKGLRHIGQTLDLKEETARLEQVGQDAARAGMPPQGFTQIMLSDYGRVAAFPWEITGLQAAGLSWQLLPTLQYYSAYTARLDTDTAAVFSREDRPKWIWIMNIEIDGRSQFSDNPETWLAIMDHYGMAATDGGTQQILLRSREPTFSTRTGAIVRQTTAKAGEWVDIDDMSRLWRVEIDLRPTLWGSLARLAYTWPPVSMEVIREHGSLWRFRILPDTARTGLLLPLQPGSIEEVASVMTDRPANRVKRFRIVLPGGGYFEQSIPLRWRQTSRVFDQAKP